ncbi:MAG: hypothetical protein IKQ61_03915 [Spirochaetales bacterium]|nr:hypothetical protein [Spirochaetales bacterium]
MPYAVLAEKLKMMPERYFDEISDFLDFLLFRNKETTSNTPNAELLAAIQESEQMLNDPNAVRFDSVDALFADLDSED